MKRKLIAWVATVAMAAVLPLSVQSKAPSVAELIPADSFGYAELSDLGVFYYVVSEMGAAVVQSLEEEEEVPEDASVKARALLAAFNEIKPLLPKSGSLGFISFDPQEWKPQLVLVTELSDALAPLASAGSKLLAAAPDVELQVTDYGTEYTFEGAPIPPIGIAIRENVLYATMGEGLLDRVVSGSVPNRLCDSDRFRAVDAVARKNAFVSAYLNVDAIREKLMPVLPPEANEVVELLGLKEVHAAGFSLTADDEHVSYNMALHYTEGAPGIPDLLSVPNTQPKGIAYVPESYSYVSRLSLGPPDELFTKIRSLLEKAGVGEEVAGSLAEIRENTGIDVERLLASLGGEITLGAKVPETLTIPDMVACIEAREPEYLTTMLRNLLGAEESPATITEMEIAGRKAMLISPKGESPVRPALAVDGDMIVVGVSQAALEQALAAKANGQNIGSKPRFKEAMEGLPASSNVGLEYIEMGDLGRLVIQLLEMNMANENIQEDMKPFVDRTMEHARRALKDLEDGVEIVYRTPEGLVLRGRWGTRSVMQLLTNGAAFGTKVLMWVLHARAFAIMSAFQ